MPHELDRRRGGRGPGGPGGHAWVESLRRREEPSHETHLANGDDVHHWIRGLWHAMQSFSMGKIYVNYESDVGVDRVQAAYGPEKYARLVALKRTYNPKNLFRLNANITPTV